MAPHPNALATMERNKRIAADYAKGGRTLREVGKNFGIGPERVRQIVRMMRRKQGMEATKD